MQPRGLKISTETVRVPGLRPDGPFAWHSLLNVHSDALYRLYRGSSVQSL